MEPSHGSSELQEWKTRKNSQRHKSVEYLARNDWDLVSKSWIKTVRLQIIIFFGLLVVHVTYVRFNVCLTQSSNCNDAYLQNDKKHQISFRKIILILTNAVKFDYS